MKSSTLFVGAFSVGACLALSTETSAGWLRMSSSACMTWPVVVGSTILANPKFGINAPNNLSHDSTTDQVITVCPVPESAEFQKHGLTARAVHGEDRNPNASLTATACISYWNVTGGECGSPHSSGNAFLGNVGLQPGLEKWTAANAAHFGYIHVVIPQRNNANGNSAVSGYFLQQ